jgi:hypothetical protein
MHYSWPNISPMATNPKSAEPLAHFVGQVAALVDQGMAEPELHAAVRDAMKDLVASDDWLPAEMPIRRIGSRW